MIPWKQFPMLRILIPFVTGVFLQSYFPNLHCFWWISPILTVLYGIAFYCCRKRRFYIHHKTGTFLLFAALFTSGCGLTHVRTTIFSPFHFSKFISQDARYLIEVKECIRHKTTTKLIAVVKVVYSNNTRKTTATKGQALVYLLDSTFASGISIGSQLWMKADFHSIPGPRNPGAFDYSTFMKHKDINQFAYLQKHAFRVLPKTNHFSVQQTAKLIHEYLSFLLKHPYLKPREQHVITSLLLGDTDQYQDKELMKAFAATGTLHILSVSGMHVGLVYISLQFMLGFLTKIKGGNALKNSVILAVIWLYALIAGLSPSVLRSAFMLSIIIISQVLRKESNIYNSLAASAFVLLVIQPQFIHDIGFQLSYLAVAGIVYLFPKLTFLYSSPSLVWRCIGKSAAVSIAAQLTTTPLSLFYFHQFPNFFLLANLLIVPISTLLIYSGIFLAIFHPFNLVTEILAKLMQHLAYGQNEGVLFIQQLPGSVLSGISWGPLELVNSYLLLIFLLLAFQLRSFSWLRNSLFCLLLLTIFQSIASYNKATQCLWIVYANKNKRSIDFISGNHHQYLSDQQSQDSYPEINANQELLGLTILAPSSLNGEQIINNHYLKRNKEHFLFAGKHILFLENKEKRYTVPAFTVDYILISHNACDHIPFEWINSPNTQVIADATNSRTNTEKWKKECEARHISFYSVATSGAFVEAISNVEDKK